MALEAYYSETGKTVKVGDTVTSFRGREHVLKSIDRATEPGRSGKVTVEGSPVSYYSEVFDLKVREV